MGGRSILSSQNSDTQAAGQDNLKTVHSDGAGHVPTTTARVKESTPIEPTDEKNEKDVSDHQQKRTQYLLKLQQDRLQKIEKQATQKRQEIEKFYLQKCRELQIRTEEKIRFLDSDEKVAWAELNQKLKHTITTTEESVTAVSYILPNNQNINTGVVDSRVDEYAVGHFISEKTSETNVVNNPAKEYATKQQQITKTENRVLTYYKQELAHFQRWRQFELDKIEQWERLQKSYVSTAIRDITAKPKSKMFGLVTSIMYSEDKPSVVLGNKRLMHEGDIIREVTIGKIYEDKVEFIKNEERWTQKVGETPGSEWLQ